MPVVVVNRHTYKGDGIYIGRGKDAPFGNPYTERPLAETLAKYQVATRAESISKYRDWVHQQWEQNDTFRRHLIFLVKKHLQGEHVVLVCSCAPKPCHGNVLKEIIEQLAELRVVTLDDRDGSENSPTINGVMKVAVVGSRSFRDYPFLSQRLDWCRWLWGDFIVVTGGAPGADILAVKWANERGLLTPIIYPALWDDLSQPDAVIKTRKDGSKYDARAGFRRNQLILDSSGAVVAFWDGKSAGTQDTLEKARLVGKLTVIFWPGKCSVYSIEYAAFI